MLARMLERLGEAAANKTLAKYSGDLDRAYEAVQKQTAGIAEQRVDFQLLKTLVDFENKTMLSGAQYTSLLKALSGPKAFLLKARDAVKELVTLSMAAAQLQQRQLEHIHAEATDLNAKIDKWRAGGDAFPRKNEANAEQEKPEGSWFFPRLRLPFLPRLRMTAKPTPDSTLQLRIPRLEPAEEEVIMGARELGPDERPLSPEEQRFEMEGSRLHARYVEVLQRQSAVFAVVKAHAQAAFPALRGSDSSSS
eukprot:2441202-Rhodomonas_salina.1